MKKIEIATWHKCNARCAFCASRTMEDKEFGAGEIVKLLKKYKDKGATAVDFGGGEPTAREDLPVLAEAAATLGYKKIGVKSNGMRFCYPDYARSCMESGVNEFSISIWGHSPEVHDSLAGREGAFEMTEMGLKHLVDLGANVCVDFLLTTRSVGHVEEALTKLNRGVGVKKFTLWLFSIFGAGGRGVELLPRLSEAGKRAAAAREKLKKDVEHIKTSHIPPCFLKGHEEMYYNIRELELLIITPGSSFMGEESPFETGAHVKACFPCRLNTKCPGPRPEYVKIHGENEFKPIV